MQKISTNELIERAVALLNDKTVSSVLGWKKGEFDYDVTYYHKNTKHSYAHIFKKFYKSHRVKIHNLPPINRKFQESTRPQ